MIMNQIGDYYDIQPLVKFANNRVEAILRSTTVKEDVIPNSLPDAIHEARNVTADLQDLIAEGVARNILDLFKMNTFKDFVLLPRFAISVLRYLLLSAGPPEPPVPGLDHFKNPFSVPQ
jgi:hypothetical protein